MKPTCFANTNTFKDNFVKHVRFPRRSGAGYHTIKIIDVADTKMTENLLSKGGIGFATSRYHSGIESQALWGTVIGRDIIVPVISSKNRYISRISEQGVSAADILRFLSDSDYGTWGTLLKEIEKSYSSNGEKTIGLFSVDLFIPIMTYIFGQAFLNGQTGIASLYRLSNERYGMKSDDKLILDRFKKVVIHELGHAFGLIHCHVQTCVMKSSTYVEDIDQKSQKYCLKCLNELKR